MKIKTKVEHRLGEVLKVTVKQGGDRKSEKSNGHNVHLIPEEITQKQSSRMQQLAAMPWEKIEEKIATKMGEVSSGYRNGSFLGGS